MMKLIMRIFAETLGRVLIVFVFAFALVFALAVIGSGISSSARAQEAVHGRGAVFVVASPSASLYSEPDESKLLPTQLKRGRRVQVSGEEEGGFLRLLTKSGSTIWIRASDVTSERSKADQDLVEPGRMHAPATEKGPVSSWLGIERATFDIGLSGGSYGGKSYTEGTLGLNLYFTSYLAWRNAIFGRFQQDAENLWGLDTSPRLILGIGGAAMGLTLFGGPGYRFQSRGTNVPFAEGGVVFKLVGIAIGGGVKTLFNSAVHSGVADDTQYFLILAGGGSL